MIQIRPVSDLRNKFTEIEEIVTSTQSPVFLTKNGYGSMVVMSLKAYENMTNNIEAKLDEADNYAEVSDVRLSHDEIMEIRRILYSRRNEETLLE
jgi:prevent-host-death family protein